jgi:hypothetical protein
MGQPFAERACGSLWQNRDIPSDGKPDPAKIRTRCRQLSVAAHSGREALNPGRQYSAGIAMLGL